jgi:hypothetical protein
MPHFHHSAGRGRPPAAQRLDTALLPAGMPDADRLGRDLKLAGDLGDTGRLGRQPDQHGLPHLKPVRTEHITRLLRKRTSCEKAG